MADPYNTAYDKPMLKRKHVYEETDDVEADEIRRFKRSNWARLPIRPSSNSPPDRLRQNTIPEIQRPLTPVDSSDDEAHGQAHNAWFHRRKAMAPTERHPDPTDVSWSSEAVHEEMELGSFFSPVKKHDSYATPHRQINHISTGLVSSEGRIPTPIKATFGFFGETQPTRGRQLTRQTMLSPVMNEEPFLPSPMEPIGTAMDADLETTIRMEHASNGFGALSVACKDDAVMVDADQLPHETKANSANITRSGSRKAKLHMGFRADCEKCQQRVPGHYSHIIWS